MAIEPSAAPRSRRALLAGALGGVAAAAATMLGRPAPALAAAGDPLVIGSEANNAGSANTQLLTNSDVVAFKLLQNGPGTALMGYATPASGATRGVYGRSDSPNGYGVQARNAGAAGTGAAIQAIGVNNHGIDASADNDTKSAVRGIHSASGAAIYGFAASGAGVYGQSTSENGVFGLSSSGRGVYGYSNFGTGVHGRSSSGSGMRGESDSSGYGVVGGSFSGIGVFGSSTNGVGVWAASSTDYAGYFEGTVGITEHIDVHSTPAPGNPGGQTARLFVRYNAGKIELCVIFPTGGLLVIKAEA